MKASTIIAVATTLTASFVSAQLGNIPQCALSCALTSLQSTSCAPTDIKCICQATGFVAALTPCVEKACTAAELQQTITAAEGLCSSAGVSLSIPPVAASSTSASSEASSASIAPTTTAVSTSAVTTTATTMATTTAVVVVVPSVYTNATMTVAPTGNSSTTGVSTTSLPTASPSGNAALRNGASVGGLAAVLAFAAALL